MNLLKTTILILILLIITSCAAKREQTYLKKDNYSCNVVCIGDVKFKNQSSSQFRLFNYKETKRFSNWTSGAEDHCIAKQYRWDAIDQKEIDTGLQICSAQIGVFDWVNEGVYHCAPYDSNLDEKTNILRSLNSCQKRLNYYLSRKPIPISSDDLKKERQEKEQEEQEEKVNKAKQTCRSLGFTEAQHIAECGLKILTAEKDLNTNVSSNNTNDALARQIQLNNSIRLMQQGLKLMNPPPRPQINCRTTLLGWTCN